MSRKITRPLDLNVRDTLYIIEFTPAAKGVEDLQLVSEKVEMIEGIILDPLDKENKLLINDKYSFDMERYIPKFKDGGMYLNPDECQEAMIDFLEKELKKATEAKNNIENVLQLTKDKKSLAPVKESKAKTFEVETSKDKVEVKEEPKKNLQVVD